MGTKEGGGRVSETSIHVQTKYPMVKAQDGLRLGVFLLLFACLFVYEKSIGHI